MTTTINADTSTGGAVISGDSSGVLGLLAGGNTVLTLNSSRAVGVGASPSYGTAGQILTSQGSAAAPTWSTGLGEGGTTLTGNVTLTSSSAATMTVTPTSPGLYATLPNATTCFKADNLFAIYNVGDYDYGVKDSAGTQLGWVRSKTGAVIGLSDNSTAAGVWAYYGLEKIGVTAAYSNPTLANMAANIRRIALDANRTCFLFGGVDCYAIVYDASTATWGSATLVRATVASGGFVGILSTTNQVLVVSSNSTTGMEAVTLTISGTTITVNTGTKATATLGGNFIAVTMQLIAVSTSFVVGYNYSNTKGIRAITVSGTTPTIGSESAVAPGYTGDSVVPTLYASGSIVRTVCFTAATTISATPYTVSGSTLTLGTAATATASVTGIRTFVNGNGNIVCNYINTTNFVTVFKLTATTEAASSISLGTVPNNLLTTADYVQITASKTAFVYYPSGTAYYANILTDTSGTASVGTEISGSIANALAYVAGITVSGNSARFAVGSATFLGQITLDCSGTSPTLSSYTQTTGPTSTLAQFSASDIYGARSIRTYISGTSAYAVGANSYMFDQVLTANSVGRRVAASLGLSIAAGVVGSASNETFLVNIVGSAGIIINRVESAA